MVIQTKLSEKDFINASLIVMRKRFSLFGIIFIVVCLINLINSRGKPGNLVATIVPFLIIAGLFSVVYYFGLKKAYHKTPRASENKIYTFLDDHINIEGESFTIQLNWTAVKKVIKTNKWIFIYENSMSAYPISISDITHTQLENLKKIVTVNGVKNNL